MPLYVLKLAVLRTVDFQGIPVTVYIPDAVGFGLDIKFYILHENEEASTLQTTRRNVFEVSLCTSLKC